MAIYESLFFIEMILQFLRKVTPDGSSTKLSDIKSIAKYYIQTNFIWHFIPLFPFQYIKVVDDTTNQYFLILKVIRLFFGFECYDVPAMMNIIKRFRMRLLN